MAEVFDEVLGEIGGLKSGAIAQTPGKPSGAQDTEAYYQCEGGNDRASRTSAVGALLKEIRLIRFAGEQLPAMPQDEPQVGAGEESARSGVAQPTSIGVLADETGAVRLRQEAASQGTQRLNQAHTVSIRNPDGTQFLSQGECGATYFSDIRVLPATGVYVITVNPGGTTFGSATLTLYNIPPDPTRTITVGGPAASVTTTVPGQNATVTFNGLAGQSITVRMTGNTMGFVTIVLGKPDGSTLASSSSTATSFNLASQTLPVAGIYTIFVNPNSTSTGTISVATSSP